MPCRRWRVPRPASQKTEHVTFHRGDGTLHMGSIRGKAHILPDNAHINGQHSSGAMERYKWVQFARKLSPRPATTHRKTVSVPVGRWNVTCMGSIRRKTHGALPRHTTNSEHTSGAMERYTWVRFAGKLSHCPAMTHRKTVSVYQWGDGGNVWDGSKCKHSPTATPSS